MTRMKHAIPTCGHLIPKVDFERRTYVWDSEFTEDDGAPLVMLNCPGCGSDVSTRHFVPVRGSSLPPPATSAA